MTAKTAGRHGSKWRTIRARVLATSDICWLCGHPDSDSADHLIPRAIALAAGRNDLLEDISNLAPAHHKPCPTCGIRCNRARGLGIQQKQSGSRRW